MSDLSLSVAQASRGIMLAGQHEAGLNLTGPRQMVSRLVEVNALQDAAFEALVRALIAKGIFTRDEAQEFLRLTLNDTLSAYETKHGRQFRLERRAEPEEVRKP